MKVFILFAQRHEEYQGQHAPECLAAMSEWDAESNPAYLHDEKVKADASGEFERTEIVTLHVPTDAVMARLRPAEAPISATVS